VTTGQAVVIPAQPSVVEPAVGERESTPLARRTRWRWLLAVVVLVVAGGAVALVYGLQQTTTRTTLRDGAVDSNVPVDARSIAIVNRDAAAVVTVPVADAGSADPWAVSHETSAVVVPVDASIDAGMSSLPRRPHAATSIAEAQRTAMQMQQVFAPCQHYLAQKVPDTKAMYECMCKPTTEARQQALQAIPELVAQCKSLGF
jgi:hypothetical protein